MVVVASINELSIVLPAFKESSVTVQDEQSVNDYEVGSKIGRLHHLIGDDPVITEVPLPSVWSDLAHISMFWFTTSPLT
eukprot:scaffold72627_cov54-Attheya_sp.AAC.2